VESFISLKKSSIIYGLRHFLIRQPTLGQYIWSSEKKQKPNDFEEINYLLETV
jgi:hypothetical protein